MLDFKKNWIFFLILIFILNLFFIIYYYNKILQNTNNYFTYPLDDTYIHLAMAKNFKNHKVIGINGEFASTTSSPFFTILISLLFLIFGTKAEIPLILNIFISFLILTYIFFLLKKYFNYYYIFLFCIFFYFIIPFPTLIFSGLEHLLHILFCLLFLNKAVEFIILNKKYSLYLFILSIFCISTRYESIFFIFPLLLLLLWKKKFKGTFLVLLGTALPVLFYGVYSLKKGWLFLPSSIFLKGYLFHFGSIKKIFLQAGEKVYNEILTNPFLIPILLLCLFSLYHLNKKIEFFKSKTQFLSFILFFNIIFHLHFSRTGYLYRYEAYILAISFILFIYFLKEFEFGNKLEIISKVSFFLIVLLGILPIIIRGYNGFVDMPIASKNIYEQQIQMAKFLQRYYERDWVGVNDIGAVCFFKEKVLDIWGLGDIDITKKMIERKYNKEYLLKKIFEIDIKVLVVYEKTFEYLGGTPGGLLCAGKWQIKNNKVCGYDTISFYAREKDFPYLIKNLRDFSKELPKDVFQSGLYLE